jgi:hypothetical protein
MEVLVPRNLGRLAGRSPSLLAGLKGVALLAVGVGGLVLLGVVGAFIQAGFVPALGCSHSTNEEGVSDGA